MEESRVMAMPLKRKKEYRGFNFFLCVLFAGIVLFLCSPAGYCEAGLHQPLNASGNRNITPSVDPIGKDEGFEAVLYNIKNGLPTSEVNAVAQTGEGFIWIGSYAGLIRYDGNTFEHYDSDVGIPNVRCLFVDRSDRLWIGTNDSGIFLLSKGELHHWDKSDGLESLSYRWIAEGEDGLIYIGGTLGVGFVDASLQYSPIEDQRISGQMISELRAGGNGLIYGLSSTGDLFTLKDGELVSYYKSGSLPFGTANSIYPDPEHPGCLYVGTEHSIWHGNPEQETDAWKVRDIFPLSGVQGLEYIDGKLWICSRTGLGRLESRGVRLLQNIPMNNSFYHIMTDSEGNLWVTSGRQGVMKIVPNRFTDLFDRYGIAPEVVNSTCLLDDQLFVGTENGLIVIKDRKKIEALPITKAVTASGAPVYATDLLQLLDGIRIRSINRDSKDRLWISTSSRYSLIRYDHGELIEFTVKDGLVSSQIRTVSECADGSMLVATNDGFNVIEGDRVVKGYGEQEGIDVRLTLSIIEGDNHELIAGSDGGGIYIVSDEGLKRIGSEDGLNSEVVLRIRRSRTRDLYWIITGNSLACMTPDYQVTTVHEFLYDNNYDLYENSRGDLWLLGSTGIFVIFDEDLILGEPVNPVFLGIPSGLPYVATANSYSELTDEGDLFISSNEGVIKVNIDQPFENTVKVKLSVPYVDSDGKQIYPNSEGVFVIPGSTRKLTVYPYVFNYSLIDPEVSWRLVGFDEEVASCSRSELQPVYYTNLAGGIYTFEMSVKDPVTHTGETVSFQIIKGNPMTVGNAGSIIMDVASLFFMCGILVYTTLYRKRGRLDDRLFYVMVLVNIALAVADGVSYFLEGSSIVAARWLMIACNIVFYEAFAVFPYLFLLYLDYRAYQDKKHTRTVKLLTVAPCLLLFILLMINFKTGWIFWFSEDNMYHSGPLNNLVFIPVIFYVLICLYKVSRTSFRLVFLGLLLIAVRIVWGIWFRGISSTAFTYTLFLVCTHIYVMNRPINEVMP